MDFARVYTAHVDAWQAHGRVFEPYGGGTAELPGMRLMASGLPYPYLNTACVLDAGDADIGSARAWYARRGLAFGAIVPTGTSWPHGRRLLEQRLMAALPGRFTPAPLPVGLVLRRARPADMGDVTRVDNGAFRSDRTVTSAWLGPLCGSGEVEIALAELDGEPVATGYGTRCLGEAGRTLYLGGIGVLPARRRGVAAALSSWLVVRGFEQGAELAHLQTESDDAARVYARLGFEQCSGIDIYSGG